METLIGQDELAYAARYLDNERILLIEDGRVHDKPGHLVVVVPDVTDASRESFKDVVKYEESIGITEDSTDAEKFMLDIERDTACSLAESCWRSGNTEFGKYGGAAVAHDGLVVAFSGVQKHFDLMLAKIAAAVLTAYNAERHLELEDAERLLRDNGLQLSAAQH